MKIRIRSIFVTVLLVLSLTFSVSAAEASEGPNLNLEMSQNQSSVFLSINLKDVDATNGRFCLTYDKDVLSYEGYVVVGKWTINVNAETDGEIWVAWIGRQETQDSHLLVTFKLQDNVQGEVSISTEITELYKNGNKVVADDTDLVDEISIEVIQNSNTGGGYYPLPTPPTPPVYPDGNEPSVDPIPNPKPTPDPEPEPDTPEHPFTDIDGYWAEEYIIKAWENGLVNGVAEDTFAPKAQVTRGMFVTLLYRLSGQPAVNGDTPFTDVADGMYYTQAVRWAYENAVVNGTSSTTFSPDDLVSRQEMVTMLYRYAKLTGRDVSASAAITSYADANDVANWATDAVEWAVAEGILTGYNNQLTPNNSTMRAEAATLLVRFAGL